MLRLLSPAKINLFLYVTGKRGDGYHTLETLMCPVGLYDGVTLSFGGEGVRDPGGSSGRFMGCREPGPPGGVPLS